MKYLVLILLLTLPFSGRAEDDDYQPRWMLSPFNLNLGYFKPGYNIIDDSLRASGYGKFPHMQELGGIDLELHHKSRLMVAFAMNFTGNDTDTLKRSGGRYRVREARYINSCLSIGYNIFPLRKARTLMLYPKAGVYLSRQKVRVSYDTGDTLFLSSVFGSTTTKTVRYWESGLQLGLKLSWTPFWKSNSFFAAIGVGLEAGMSYNTQMINRREYDDGDQKIIALPPGPARYPYFRIEIQAMRGICAWM